MQIISLFAQKVVITIQFIVITQAIDYSNCTVGKNPKIASSNVYKDILTKSFYTPYTSCLDDIPDRLEAIRKGVDICTENELINQFLEDKSQFSPRAEAILEASLDIYREMALNGSLSWKFKRWIKSIPNTDIDKQVKQLSESIQLKIHNIFRRHIKREKMKILDEIFNNGLLSVVSIDTRNILATFQKNIENMIPKFKQPLNSLNWDIKDDLEELDHLLKRVSKGGQSIVANHSNSEKEHAKVLKLIRAQQSQIEILEKQLQRREQSGSLSCGLSYRKPDSNLNITATMAR